MPARPQPRTASVLQIAWIVVPLLLIGWSAYLALSSQNALLDSVAVLDRGSEQRQSIRHVYSSLFEAETGQRGFLLTSREVYLVPYEHARAMLPRQVEQLGSITADEPDQQKCLVELRALMADKLSELGRTIRLAKDGDMAAALRLVNSDQGRVDMDKIRLLVRQMTINCDRAQAAKEDIYLRQSQANTRLALILVLANGVFFALAAVLLRRIRRMENLVTICAWSHTIEYQGSWMSFEEYLKLRYNLVATHGISPAEAERLTHPPDPSVKKAD
jgi:CHASE3 domain sensor protein